MVKIKKKLTKAQKAERKEAKRKRQEKYETVFMNGKQVRVKKPELIEGISLDQFMQQNADSIWLHQNEMWDLLVDDD